MTEIKKIVAKIQSTFRIGKSINPMIAKLTPPRSINWNQPEGAFRYKEKFSFNFIHYYYPYILKNCHEYGVNSNAISLLDIGCGWGPMAIPFAINEMSKGDDKRDGVGYLGIDIRKDAIDWLTRAYADYPFIKFQHHQSDAKADYIRGVLEQGRTTTLSNGDEAAYNIPNKFTHNVQWSSSVFTHLTPQACRLALEGIRNSSENNSIQINTWLIIDAESRYALALGIADRELPSDCGEYLTYSVENPLVCTAYKIEAIKKIYASAGLEILNIERGAWRGKAAKNAATHYQDIIISRPIVGRN